MTAKPARERSLSRSISGDEQARLEIEGFLQALQSYAARAAEEPDITFEQHLNAVVSYGSAVPRRRN